MGWTGQYLRPGETVRDIITTAYQGDPLGCAACSWHESAHPRVSGSDYDAIYGPRPADNPEPGAVLVHFGASYVFVDAEAPYDVRHKAGHAA